MSTRNRKPFPPSTARGLRAVWWLLGGVVLVALAIGVGVTLREPRVVPTAEPELPVINARFTDVTDRAGIRFRHTNGAAGRKLLPETMGSGVAVLDFDRDGKPDLFFVNSRPWPGADRAGESPTQALYRNRGNGTFEDVTVALGLDIECYGMGVAVADFDNDGWPDIFVTAVGGNRLFRNRDGKRFEDVTERTGLSNTTWTNETAANFARRTEPVSFPSSAVWLDYDGDGRLDLFVCNYLTWAPARDLGVAAVLPGGVRAYVPPQQFTGAQCQLFRNVDGTRFEDVSAVAGVLVTDPAEPGGAARPVGKALGVVVCDADGDGWPDIIVANDTVRNFFFHNRPGPNGSRVFLETGRFSGIAYADGRPRGGMGIDAGEVSPDTLGVVIANFTHEPDSLFLLKGTSPVLFTDAAVELGLASLSMRAMKFGAVLFDFDRDGRLDLFTANGHLEPDIAATHSGQTHAQAGQLFWNSGPPGNRFIETTGADGLAGFPLMVGRGCAYLDYDGDGKLDLVVTENNGRARLFRNETPEGNAWVCFALSGEKRQTNRDGVGAEVTVHAGGRVQRRYVTAAHGYLSQCEPTAYFGLGSAATVDRVTVRWPGRTGHTQDWQNIPAGTTYRLMEGAPEPIPVGR